MKSFALSASHAENSLNYRGLQLLNESLNFDFLDSLSNYSIPVIDTNDVTSEVPSGITTLFNQMSKFDVFIFAVPEMTGLMSAAFKNLLDWFVVQTNFNSKLGQDYPFSSKPVILLTFTPSNTEAGDRHFGTTTQLINKLGGNVVYQECFRNCWNTVIPNNQKYFRKSCANIKHYLSYNESTSTKWKQKYDEWDAYWNSK